MPTRKKAKARPTVPTGRAYGRSLADFRPLRPAEAKLLQACRMGEHANIGRGRPKKKTDKNSVRAAFVRFLALGGDESAPVHEQGVQLVGACVEGKLDLSACTIPNPLLLAHCLFDEAPLLTDANCLSLNLFGASLPGFDAGRLRCKGSLLFEKAVVDGGEVTLHSAQIGGNLSCNGAHLTGAEDGKGDALSCDGANIAGGVFLDEGFKAKGQVRLHSAQIRGNLECSGAHFTGAEDGKGDALSCDGANITGNVFLDEGFKAKGEVRLLGAQIGGNLACSDAHFTGAEGGKGHALSCDGANITGSVFLVEGFEAKGEVRLLGAQIGGSLSCDGAHFTGAEDGEGDALSCDGANITGGVLLREGFEAKGEVRLLDAQIRGNLECSGAHFTGAEDGKGDALSCDGMHVTGALFLRGGTRIKGKVSLASTHVAHLVDELVCWPKGDLVLDGFEYKALVGGASTDAHDRIEWLDRQPQTHMNEKDFRPQPWVHLIKVLRAAGHYSDARTVAIEFERRKRRAGRFGSRYRKCFHWVYGFLADYGYRPLKIVAWMLSVWFVCGFWYFYAANQGVFSPSNPLVFQHERYAECRVERDSKNTVLKSWYGCAALSDEYTTFSPLAYSLDLILPLVDLQQERDWAPMIPTPQSQGAGEDGMNRVWVSAWAAVMDIQSFSLNHFTRLVMWLEILFGWMASLLLVAVFTGMAKRDEE